MRSEKGEEEIELLCVYLWSACLGRTSCLAHARIIYFQPTYQMTDNNLPHYTTTQIGAVLSKLDTMEEKMMGILGKMEEKVEARIKERKKGIFVLQILVAILFIATAIA